jgi:flagellar motor switch protein FliM
MSASGQDAEQAVAPAEDEGEIRVRALDFAQPNKFTPELRRRISSALSPACAALAVNLSSELKVDVELELEALTQHTWAAARAGLPADSVAVAVQIDATDAQLLLSIELPWVMQALECLLGGEAARAPAVRHLTDLDRTLVQGLIDLVVGELSNAWTELGGVGGAPLSRGEIDIEGDAGLLVAPSEPTLTVSLASTMDGAKAGVSLLLPWFSFAPLAESAASASGGRGVVSSPHAAREAEDLRRGLVSAQVLVRAEVGSVQMPIERMLELVPGTLVQLDDRAEAGVRLYAEEVSVAHGRPGRSGVRRAVKVEVTGEPPRRAETYAKLGRTELERARAWVGGLAAGSERPPILHSIFVRVWAELGRTHLSLGEALELSVGTVVELDQAAEDRVELFANGLCFASGRLVVTGEGAWGVQLEQLT